MVAFWVHFSIGLNVCFKHLIQQHGLRNQGWENQGQKLCKGGMQTHYIGKTSGPYQQGQHRWGSESQVSYKRQQFPAVAPEGCEPLINGTLSGWDAVPLAPINFPPACLTSALGRKNADWHNTLISVHLLPRSNSSPFPNSFHSVLSSVVEKSFSWTSLKPLHHSL